MVSINSIEEVPPHLRGWELCQWVNIDLIDPEWTSREPVEQVSLLSCWHQHIDQDHGLGEAIARINKVGLEDGQVPPILPLHLLIIGGKTL